MGPTSSPVRGLVAYDAFSILREHDMLTRTKDGEKDWCEGRRLTPVPHEYRRNVRGDQHAEAAREQRAHELPTPLPRVELPADAAPDALEHAIRRAVRRSRHTSSTVSPG